MNSKIARATKPWALCASICDSDSSNPSIQIYIVFSLPCCYAINYEISFVVPMWPWVLSWALFCCLKKDFWPQSHDATVRILFHTKTKVNMCTSIFETSPHKWLKLFATKDLNSRWNITEESYNPVKDTGLIPYTIKRHVPSVNFWIAKHGYPVMPWSRVHHNKREVAQ